MAIIMSGRASTFWSLQALCTLLLVLPIVNGQQPDDFEGFIAGIRANAVKGEVVYQRDNAKFPIESGLRLEEGDIIGSSKDSYAELLLQPGNYLRVAGNTRFQIFSDQHDKMRLLTERRISHYRAVVARELSVFVVPDREFHRADPRDYSQCRSVYKSTRHISNQHHTRRRD